MALQFVEVQTSRRENIITVSMDGYTNRKTLLGVVHEVGKEVAKYDKNEGEGLLNVKTEREAKECLQKNTMDPNTYCFELEEVSCASYMDEEKDEVVYGEEATYYFYIRFFICEEVFPALKEKVVSGQSYDIGRDVEKIEAAKNAEDVTEVTISVEWRKSRIWGYNPFATVTVYGTENYGVFRDTASGCGYDKESAAVADALDQSNMVKRLLYKVKEKALQDGWEYGGQLNAKTESNADCIAYGAGYGTLPYFEGGVGMSSLIRVFEKCGLTLKASHSGKHYDFYHFAA